MKGRYVVFDRDGTLIKHIPYLFKADQLELFNDTISSIKLVSFAICILITHSTRIFDN